MIINYPVIEAESAKTILDANIGDWNVILSDNAADGVYRFAAARVEWDSAEHDMFNGEDHLMASASTMVGLLAKIPSIFAEPLNAALIARSWMDYPSPRRKLRREGYIHEAR